MNSISKNILRMFRKKIYSSKGSYPFLFCFLTVLSLLAGSQNLTATEPPAIKHGTGLIPLSKEQLQVIEQTWPRIVGVRANKIGVTRIQEHLQNNGFAVQEDLVPANPDEEFITVIGSAIEQKVGDSSPTALPTSINNSRLPSFPPIGDQQSEGSCVGFGSTYYQATHEIGLVNGYNNKTSNANILSPRWTYNLLNDGYDQGLFVSHAFNLLAQNGAPSIASFPYVNGDVTSWDLNAQDWINAIKNRTAPAQYVSGIGGSSQNLATIKQLLTNGHVLTYATFIYSYVFNKILQDPANPSSPYVGQQACTYMNGISGGHFLTIVGYDDNIWVDVNGNGQVDAGERGAFLVANSWGSGWGNAGFTWISYDAFLNTSAVVNGPSANRVPAAQDNYVYSIVPKAANYSPTLVGQFTLSQSYRDQIFIQAGLSTTSQTAPTQTFACYALQNQGGPFEFDGTAPGNPQTATFAVDMSDFVTPTVTQRYYLIASDTEAGNPTTLKSFSLLDLTHNKQTNYSGTPLNYDNSSVTPFIDYAFVNATDTTPPVVSFTSPVNNSTVQNSINVNINATDNVAVARVDLYVDSILLASDTVAPYFFSLDTTKYSDGSHQLIAIAYDTSNNSATTSETINIANAAALIGVNCGGGDVMYNGVDFKPDYGFSGTSNTLCSTNFQNDNVVYNTSRFGPNFSYNFNVPNGQYKVKLKFVESYFNEPNKRIFNATINGSTVITNLDLYQTYGFCVPHDLNFPITVTNGIININLVSSSDYAIISGIRITRN